VVFVRRVRDRAADDLLANVAVSAA
jgi:hypothetical protein